MTEKVDYTLKILTIGESAVGKTCILLRFTDNKFLKTHLTTIGIDYKSKTIKVKDFSVKLKIWDTAGQERFRNITQQYYKGADGILLVYDVTERNSFEKVREWMRNIQQNTSRDKIGIILVGNKCDLEERQVTTEEGESLAKEFGVLFFETSAYKDININECFESLVGEIISKKEVDSTGNNGSSVGGEKKGTMISPINVKGKEKKGCC
jgi:small GTP-binding protein